MTQYLIENKHGKPIRLETSEERAKFYADPCGTPGCVHTYRPIKDSEVESFRRMIPEHRNRMERLRISGKVNPR